jgi:parallel beta-helix repeat protein
MAMAKIPPFFLLAFFALATGCGGGLGISTGGSPAVRQVDDSAGPTQEYSTIQAAVNAARPGDIVLVHDGNYRGFTVYTSGTASNPIVIRAKGSAGAITRPNGNGEGITLNNAHYVTIEGFTVKDMPRAGIASHRASAAWPMRGVIIRNNIVQNSGFMNIYMSQTAESLIEGNIASGSATSHGIYLSNGGSDNTILRGNRCFGNAKNGIHFNGDSSMGGDGLHRGLIIENNVIYGNTANGLDMDGVQDSLIRNNLIYGNGRNALRAFRIDAAAGPKNLRIVNNTLLVTNGSGWALKLSEDLGGHVIFNNILLNDNDSTGSISVPNMNFVSNHNALVGRLSFDGETSMVNLSTWQAAGFDTNSFMAAPVDLFVNTATDNYRLKAGALAIDAGLASLDGIAAPATDILGNARPRGSAHDLGAYESN